MLKNDIPVNNPWSVRNIMQYLKYLTSYIFVLMSKKSNISD